MIDVSALIAFVYVLTIRTERVVRWLIQCQEPRPAEPCQETWKGDLDSTSVAEAIISKVKGSPVR